MQIPYGAEHLAGVFLAQASGGDIDIVTLVNYGVLGLILLLLVTNRLALPREVKAASDALAEERRAHAATKAELAEERRGHDVTRAVVYNALIGDVMPALRQSTAALGRESPGLPGGVGQGD